MAQSPSHIWGQIIGNAVELGVLSVLEGVAGEYGLYLDRIGPRPARSGKKLTWVDQHGNKHDLDYVLERGGSATAIGSPVGFIEVAWRRYTKHSKNKAQEIRGAVLPLAETYHQEAPFLGAIIAGEFTGNALTQLESLGFQVLYFPYADVLTAFAEVGINAGYEEDTPTAEFDQKIAQWSGLTAEEQAVVVDTLMAIRDDNVQQFAGALRATIGRTVDAVLVMPLYGSSIEFQTLDSALDYLEDGTVGNEPSGDFVRVELEVRYTNGDTVRGSFAEADAAADFLRAVGA